MDELSSIMQQNDFEGISQRMKMLLDIIGEQKEKLELQEKNIRYTSVHIERAKQYPEKIFVDVQEINAWFEPVEIRENNTFQGTFEKIGSKIHSKSSLKYFSILNIC